MPFLALRSYLPADHPDKHLEIGSEPTPAAFLDTLLGLSAEWRRVLAPHGSIAVELGDTYSGSGGAGGDYGTGEKRKGPKFAGSALADRKNKVLNDAGQRMQQGDGWPMDKSLTMVPESYRLALAYGHNPLTGAQSPAGRWRVRNVIRWVRPNPPVGALGDKVRPATSDMVWACTSRTRWFDLDAVRQPYKPANARTAKGVEQIDRVGKSGDDARGGNWSSLPERNNDGAGAPPLDWWNIPPGGYRGSHYAVFPAELCRIPIQASCPRRVCRTCGEPSRREVEHEKQAGRPTKVKIPDGAVSHPTVQQVTGVHVDRAIVTTTGWSSCGCPGTDGIRLDGYHTGAGWRPGVVLDPFAGSGTTLLVASGMGRDSIGIDLDPRNLDLARERLGMFLTVFDERTAS